MYTKFDFEKFEQSRAVITVTLDSLDALDTEQVDFAKHCKKLNDDERILIEERAAIMEFDGLLPRSDAESLAIKKGCTNYRTLLLS